MPRVLVTTDDAERRVLMNERVVPDHLASEHHSLQLVQRVAWGIRDAETAEIAARDSMAAQDYREVPAG